MKGWFAWFRPNYILYQKAKFKPTFRSREEICFSNPNWKLGAGEPYVEASASQSTFGSFRNHKYGCTLRALDLTGSQWGEANLEKNMRSLSSPPNYNIQLLLAWLLKQIIPPFAACYSFTTRAKFRNGPQLLTYSKWTSSKVREIY